MPRFISLDCESLKAGNHIFSLLLCYSWQLASPFQREGANSSCSDNSWPPDGSLRTFCPLPTMREQKVTSCLSSLPLKTNPCLKTERSLLTGQSKFTSLNQNHSGHCIPCSLKTLFLRLCCAPWCRNFDFPVGASQGHRDHLLSNWTNGHQHPLMVSVCWGPRTFCPHPSARSMQQTKVSRMYFAYFSSKFC